MKKSMKNCRKIYLVLLSAATALLPACYGDKGNYDYAELDEVAIAMDNAYSVLIRDTLSIEPDLSGHGFSPDAYDYEWKVYETAGTDTPVVIGTERNLDYYVSLVPGMYKLAFTVKGKDADYFYRRTSDLEVKTTTSRGWLVLCSDDGRVRLDMISHITGETYYDLLRETELENWQTPRQLVYAPDMAEPFYLVSGSGTTRLSDNEFQWNESYMINNEFGGGIFSKGVVFLINKFPGKMLIDDTDGNTGYSYYCSTLMGDGLFGGARKNMPGVYTGFRKWPAVGCNVLAEQFMPLFMLWDVTNKTFFVCTDQFASLGMSLYATGDIPMSDLVGLGFVATNDALFSWPKRSDNMTLCCLENTRYDKNQTGSGVSYAILAKGDSRYLYGIILGDLVGILDGVDKYGTAYEKAYYVDVSSCTDIAQASHFAFSSLKTMFYYSVGSKIYAVNFTDAKPEAVLQLDLGDEEITLLKFNLFVGDDPENRSYDLLVGSTAADGEGVLRVYDGFGNEGDFANAQPEEIGRGFAPIVDVIYRE